MPVRHKRRESITPDSSVTLSIKQILVVFAAVVAIASGYFYMVWNQAAANKDIQDIKASVSTVTQSAAVTTKEQDEKREQLGKDFIASTDKIASKVNDLSTQMALTQQETKVQTDTLTKISNQLGELSLASGHPARR